jgi:NDP-sugar pyrophosphorylase family protein
VRRFVVSRYSYKYEKGGKSIWLHESQQPRVCFRRYGLFVGQILSRKAQRMYVHELTREHEWVDIDKEDDLESARKMVEEERFLPEWT